MSFFQFVVSSVARLDMGDRIAIDGPRLAEGWGEPFASLFGGRFTPADRVLENVIGSSVTHLYRRLAGGDVLFQRLHAQLPDGVRSYVSPDRLGWFEVRADRLYQHGELRLTAEDEAKIRCALHGHRWEKSFVMPLLPLSACVPIESTGEETIKLVEGQICYNCRLAWPIGEKHAR